MEIAARQYNPNPLTFGPRRTLAGWGERLCLSPLPNGECQSLGGVQGALFKGQPCWGSCPQTAGATLTVGYPDECPPQTDRLPLEALVHREVYQDYTEQSINEFYLPKENLPENLEFVKVNQKKTLAQVFAEVRYNKADNEAISDVLMETLKKQGFLK